MFTGVGLVIHLMFTSREGEKLISVHFTATSLLFPTLAVFECFTLTFNSISTIFQQYSLLRMVWKTENIHCEAGSWKHTIDERQKSYSYTNTHSL